LTAISSLTGLSGDLCAWFALAPLRLRAKVIRVLGVEHVTALAGCFAEVNTCYAIATANILLPCRWLKMRWVNAGPITAEMVQPQAVWDLAVEHRVSDAVGRFTITADFEDSISSTTSANLIPALDYALVRGAWIAGIVGRDKGYIQRVANAYVVVPTVNEEHVTPHAESFQSVLCHLLVWHPALQ